MAKISGNGTITSSVLAINLQNPIFTVDYEGSNPLSFSGTLAGFLALTKTGPREPDLNGTNSYQGATTIGTPTVSGGVLGIPSSTALGSSPSVTVNCGSELDLANCGTLSQNFTISGYGLSSTHGAIDSLSGNNLLTGSVTLSAASTIGVAAGSLTIGTTITSGLITGTGPLTVAGSGTLALAGTDNNTYTGTTEVKSGLLTLGKTVGGSLAIPGDLTIDAGATVQALAANQVSNTATLTVSKTGSVYGVFDLNGNNETVKLISGTGQITDSGATATLTVATNGTADTFDGTLANALALTKSLTGTLTLTATNTYTGGTEISGGVLAVSGGNNLGNVSATVSIDANGELDTTSSLSNNLTLAGTLVSVSGNNTISGTVTLVGNPTMSVTAGVLTISGQVTDSGPANLTIGTGSGTLKLALLPTTTAARPRSITAGCCLSIPTTPWAPAP